MSDAAALNVIVIGLPRRPDRRATLESLLQDLPKSAVRFAADLGLAVDWRDWSPTSIDELRARVFAWCDPSQKNPWWTRHLKLGEIACTLSHWNVWSLARAEGLDTVVVLEDDARPTRGLAECATLLAELSAMDPRWDLLYLGRARMRPDREALGTFVRPDFSYCTYGYVLSDRGIAKLLATDLLNAIIPADEFLPAMYLEHPRLDVRQRFSPVLSAYGLADDLVVQQPKEACGSDTEASPFLEPTGATIDSTVG